jgi:multidrug efflux pump subunit AcrB
VVDGHKKGVGARLAGAFDRGFDRFRNAYGRLLESVLGKQKFVLGCVAILIAITGAVVPVVGTDFFPAADVGIIKLHVRAPRGTRLEGTEQTLAAVEDRIREIIPPKELRTINETIGVPGGLNLAFVPSDNVSGADAEMLISLNKPHKPSEYYRKIIREKLAEEFPGTIFYFQTADIVSQVLNFGLSAPIDIQIMDANLNRGYAAGQKLLNLLQRIPGVVDAHVTPGAGFPGSRSTSTPALPSGFRSATSQQHADLAGRQRW